MKDKKMIQTYVNNFRRRISSHLKPGIGIHCSVHPSEEGGAILEFHLGQGIENTDEYQEISPNLSGALSAIPQRAFGGNLEGFRFAGTNLIMEKDRIVFIKDDSPSEWNDDAAKNDISKILNKPSGDKR